MQPVQLRRGCRRADGWSSSWHTSWLILKKMLMINTLLYTMPSFKMTQRWSFWRWRQLGLTGSFRNLLGLLLSSKVPSNGKRSTQCTHSHPIPSSGNRWGTICHWHTGSHTQLTPGESLGKQRCTIRMDYKPTAVFPFRRYTWLYSLEVWLCFLNFIQSFSWVMMG